MDPPLFLSLYVMFNIYMYLMAFMYAPSDISNYRQIGNALKDIDQDKERQKIMKEFYETELNDEKEDASKKMKSGPKDSKQKLWESLVQDAGGDSSEDEEKV